jgi:hypothetical protein
MPSNLSTDVIDALTKRTQDGGTEVVQAKAGKVWGWETHGGEKEEGREWRRGPGKY